MKKALFSLFVICLLCLCCLGACSSGPTPSSGTRLDIPSGFVSKEEHFDKNGFQDFTDYCKYSYPDSLSFEQDPQYRMLTEGDLEEVRGYFDDFSKWMKTEHRLEEYDFDESCISEGDFAKIESEYGHGHKYYIYTVYFFDTDSCTLYYIHENN
ncbi:MAG: hypothetical protein IK149_01015 [Oscillospiraceae bacterium]|nr:hypothetical protein [Oscillospiraceae bacterium]